MTVNGNTLYFANDTVTYNGTTYYYVKNLQGDIVAILDSSGTAVVEYTYNAWGVLLSTTGSMASTLGVHNPLRYRGYIYDPETALYYLQSRYYDPDVGRFINADAFASTGQGILGNNMFAYCRNNPVSRIDPSGTYDCCFADDDLGNILSDNIGVGGRFAGAGGGSIGGRLVSSVISAAALATATSRSEPKKQVALPLVETNNETAGIYTVYFLSAKGGSGDIIYVERVKTANFEARMTYHDSKNREPEYWINNLTYDECRFLEQVGMMHYHSIAKGLSLHNQIRGISPTNPKRFLYFCSRKNVSKLRAH